MGVQDRDWYWDRREPHGFDGEHRGYERQAWPQRISAHPVALVVSVLIGATLAQVGYHAYSEWRVRVALQDMLEATAAASRKAQLQLERQEQAAAAQRRARQAEIDRQEAIRVQNIEQREKSEQAFRQAMQAATERRAKAWAKFYRPSPGCADSATVECANEFIKAKRAFEEKVARGDF